MNEMKQNANSGIMAVMILLVCCTCSTVTFDLVIQNGQIYSGVGNDPIRADIGIVNDRIVSIGDLSDARTSRVIDASGLAVTPGFIDLHTHLDPLLEMPDAESHVRQGITLALGGPDGGGPWPLKDYFDTLEQVGLAMNIAMLAGHNTIRKEVMGLENRAPSDAELNEMKELVGNSMKDGAFGLSTGLKYLPGTFSNVDEVIELASVAGAMGGIYTSHLREEGLGLIEGVQEAIDIADRAEIPVVLTHHKVVGKPMWGSSIRTLAMVDSARNGGLDVRIDQYPYIASYTNISILIPSWSMAGGQEAFEKRIENPILRDSIKRGIVFNLINDRGGADLDRVQFAKVKWMPTLEGKTLGFWAQLKELKPTMENGANLVIEAQLNGGASCVFFAMNDEDVDRIMQHPVTMIASDGRLTRPGIGHPHPRWYGTFPRVLGHYVREKKLLPLAEAIQKMTSLPAEALGLEDRGELKEGNYADIVIFNPETITDRSTFEDPHQYPDGMKYVIVNGVITVEEERFTDNRAGRVIYGPARK